MGRVDTQSDSDDIHEKYYEEQEMVEINKLTAVSDINYEDDLDDEEFVGEEEPFMEVEEQFENEEVLGFELDEETANSLRRSAFVTPQIRRPRNRESEGHYQLRTERVS